MAVLLISAFTQVRWSYVDTAVNLSAAADTRSWHELLSDALTKSIEYRPMLDIGTRAAYRLFGLNLETYQAIVGLEFVLILAALVLIFQPVGWQRGAAAVFALSVAVGLHTSRILFLFVPLNAYATSMLLVFAAILLVMTPGRRAVEWLLVPLTLLALLWLELGVLILPLVCVAWLMKAPRATWRGVIASFAGLAIYLVARLGFSPGTGGMYSPDTGFGCSILSDAESAVRFAGAPWLLWIPNVGVSLLTVFASELRAGMFRFVAVLLQGHAPLWMWLHVLSSIATTVLVGVYLAGIRSRPPRDRLIAALGGVLVIGGSALGFLYTRDRIGLPAGLGYAMLTYVAISALLDGQRSRRQLLLIAPVVAALGLCWTVRTGEQYVALRDTAWDYHIEWDRESARIAAAGSPMIARVRASALKHRPADAQRDPLWTYSLFERRFKPEKETP